MKRKPMSPLLGAVPDFGLKGIFVLAKQMGICLAQIESNPVTSEPCAKHKLLGKQGKRWTLKHELFPR